MNINSSIKHYSTTQSVTNKTNPQENKPIEQGQNITSAATPHREREFDFTNMTLKEQAGAAQTLYDKGFLSLGELAVMTGKYGLVKYDGQFGDMTLERANNEKFDVLAKMKEDLEESKKHYPAESNVIKNQVALIGKLEAYQYGINTKA
ncbi:hypothetical protein HR060_10475 [Catenovulum sp. SM1970]|uniref:hypothetical protein n=1 Tax=Marinifaba aquimaris TaxID=2741323 RepID=UPI0015722DAF|nr:hypothetical protein [Marinifaba aquimaris]NTS77289.1 hypothetical protein [Marinifaba aquimaris]